MAEECQGEGRESASAKSSLGIVPFGFHAKTSFDADQDLLRSRSEHFRLRPPPRDDDVWKRPPPDFRYVMFDPKPPKRNSRSAMQPERYGTIPGQKPPKVKKEKPLLLPQIFQTEVEEEKDFLTRFHVARPFSAKKEFVREGMHSAGPYVPPRLHDFRQYPPIKTLGLPEFHTSHDKDPFNLKFNSERLNIIHAEPDPYSQQDSLAGRQMAPPLKLPPKWERRLILDSESWPLKFQGFTALVKLYYLLEDDQFPRYRLRNRQPYSAFMERVERDLNTKWAKEQMERALEEKQRLQEEQEARDKQERQEQLLLMEQKRKEREDPRFLRMYSAACN